MIPSDAIGKTGCPRKIPEGRGFPQRFNRAEVTFYCENDISSDKMMKTTLKRNVQYVNVSLVYMTCNYCAWNAYCGSLVHSLIVVDGTQDTAFIVYSYNELTQNISGQCNKQMVGKGNVVACKLNAKREPTNRHDRSDTCV